MDVERREAEPTPMEPMDGMYDWATDTADNMGSNNRKWSSTRFDFKGAARGDFHPNQLTAGRNRWR